MHFLSKNNFAKNTISGKRRAPQNTFFVVILTCYLNFFHDGFDDVFVPPPHGGHDGGEDLADVRDHGECEGNADDGEEDAEDTSRRGDGGHVAVA